MTGTYKRNRVALQYEKKTTKNCKTNEKSKKKIFSTRTNHKTIAFGDRYVARFNFCFFEGIK